MGASRKNDRAGLSPETGTDGGHVDAGIRKRSVVVGGHATSVSIEQVFWDGLRRIADERGIPVNALLGEIDRRSRGNLSSAIRVFVFESLAARQRN